MAITSEDGVTYLGSINEEFIDTLFQAREDRGNFAHPSSTVDLRYLEESVQRVIDSDSKVLLDFSVRWQQTQQNRKDSVKNHPAIEAIPSSSPTFFQKPKKSRVAATPQQITVVEVQDGKQEETIQPGKNG